MARCDCWREGLDGRMDDIDSWGGLVGLSSGDVVALSPFDGSSGGKTEDIYPKKRQQIE